MTPEEQRYRRQVLRHRHQQRRMRQERRLLKRAAYAEMIIMYEKLQCQRGHGCPKFLTETLAERLGVPMDIVEWAREALKKVDLTNG